MSTEPATTRCVPPLCSRVHFDVATLTNTELVAAAELRIFASPSSPDTAATSEEKDQSLPTSQHTAPTVAVSSRQDDRAQVHRLEVHEVIAPESDAADSITRLLDTRLVTHGNASWHTFDIRPAVLKWKRSRNLNHGLEVRLVAQHAELSTEKHIRVRRSASVTAEEWAVQRPVLVVFTDDSATPKSQYSDSPSQEKSSSRPSRRRREAGSENNQKNKSRNRKERKRRRRKNRKRNKKRKGRRKKKGNKNQCKRHALYVDFKDVGWEDWIVAPSGYSAYYCHGDCMAPLPMHFTSSNHAMLQARVFKVDPTAVPMVCCVPVKMSPIPMLYMDEKGRTVLKNYQDMQVDACGCQ